MKESLQQGTSSVWTAKKADFKLYAVDATIIAVIVINAASSDMILDFNPPCSNTLAFGAIVIITTIVPGKFKLRKTR